jgi:formylglycine-generating enzyme required for sulfatase activity
MLGNAWEWVNDWYADYTRAPKTDPRGPATGTSRIARGGWFNFESKKWCRASVRYELTSPDFATSTGFRVARSP